MVIRMRLWLSHIVWLLGIVCAMQHPCQAFTVTLTPTAATSISSAYSVSLGNPKGGTYTIGFNGQVTAAIPYNASPSVVQAAITSLSTVGAGNATVSGTSRAWTVTLADSIVNASDPLTLTSSLTGGSAVVVKPLINQQQAWLISSNTANPNFLFNNNYPVQAGGQSPSSSCVYGYANAAAASGPLGYIAADFNANSTQVEVIIKGGQGTVRILVDGVVAVNCGTTVNTAGGFNYPTTIGLRNIMLDFGGVRATRRIRVECGFCVFCGASVGVNDTITQASPTTSARCFVLGDSWAQGCNGTSYMTGWPYQVGWHFGWDVWSLSQGGTGYIHTGPIGNMTYIDRALPPANAWVADIGFSSSGAYTLTYTHGGASATTAAINYNDSLATIQSDLEALPNVGAGNVNVYGNAGGVVNAQIIILFRNALAGQADLLTMNTGSLAPNTGGLAGLAHWYGDIAPFVPRDSLGQAQPFYIVIAGGSNDTPYAPNVVQAAAAALWTGLQSAFPTAILIPVGTWCTGSKQSYLYGIMSNALEAQAAVSLPAINGITPFVNMQGSVTGTGHVGMPENDGDADYYMSADGFHPTDAGHVYIGQYIANQIQDFFDGAQPWIPEPATANPNPVIGSTTQLTVLGADTSGESNLTYTWSATGPGAVSFSPNGSNEAKNAVATFTAAGSYTITAQVTDAALHSQSSSVSVTVDLLAIPIVVTPAAATPNPVTGAGAGVSVAGGYPGSGGAPSLTYAWSSTGPAPVTFSPNNNNAAASTTATFAAAGSYTLTATIRSPVGTTATSSVNVTVNAIQTSLNLTPGPAISLAPIETIRLAIIEIGASRFTCYTGLPFGSGALAILLNRSERFGVAAGTAFDRPLAARRVTPHGYVA